ncbi:AAA family ATPase [Pedobacter sp. BMA]|uniref:AAA family ATPase n=1 Tax=Pedobacter sp. BMA TaxID=1663685 RepID=UPI00064B5824|nr:AAA family ATPase [Pedobacter sp. BMA]KLT64743.1 hypothetical protein AB669_13440 [Pedobacter sp. BMA]
MSNFPDIRILAEDFRAVNHADIIINGITVVAGENGSGKSSISKLLYFLYRTVADYDRIVARELRGSLADVSRFLEIIAQETRYYDKGLDFRGEVVELRKALLNTEDLKGEMRRWIEVVEQIQKFLSATEWVKNPDRLTPRNSGRFRHILGDLLNIDYKEEDMDESFEKVKNIIIKNFRKAIDTIELRPTSLFTEELRRVFIEGSLPGKFEVQEYGDLIVALTKKNLSIPYSIQNAIYLDTPMMLHSEASNNVHWDDLEELLQKKGNGNHLVADLINSEIIQGDVYSDDVLYSTDEFKFKRVDGEVFGLLDVATGIKSFSILQILLKNGTITDKTLLILDEPESNLHPQWIIEYARIIVLLNKQLGIKFFLATHNPDMVSAIRYISEKEGVLDGTNFYLAQKVDGKFKYNYTFLDKEIDPIFESFNIALERINKYGI